MDLKKIDNYKIEESSALNDTDRKHIANYQQLIKFFENAIQHSIKEGKVDYRSLHTSCLQSIRYLDSLIHSYESAVQGVKLVNDTLEKIVIDNTPKKKLESEKEETSIEMKQ